MSQIFPKTCAMGSSKTGLVGTIGVTLLNSDGTIHTARTTIGIYEIGGGCYGREIEFENNWRGSLKWDIGGVPPIATEDINISDELEVRFNEIKGAGWTNETLKATKDVINLLRKISTNRLELSPGTDDNWILYDDNNIDHLLTFSVTDKNGLEIEIGDGSPAIRAKGI